MISSKTLVSGDPRSEDLLVSYAWALETDNQENTLLFMVFNLASFKIEGRLLIIQLLQTGGLLIPNEQITIFTTRCVPGIKLDWIHCSDRTGECISMTKTSVLWLIHFRQAFVVYTCRGWITQYGAHKELCKTWSVNSFITSKILWFYKSVNKHVTRTRTWVPCRWYSGSKKGICSGVKWRL